jgi:UDPglucose 6-dehydrogenase
VDSVASLLTTVDAINQGRRNRTVALARQAAGGTLDGMRVAVLGVAFKPNSDDVRDSPSLAVCERLRAEGAIVSVHDPVAMPNAAKRQPDLIYAGSVPGRPSALTWCCISPSGPTTGPSTPPRWPVWWPGG